jgi:hypothetical protein
MGEQRSELICKYCKKLGHMKANYFKLLEKKLAGENVNATRNCVLDTKRI